MNSPPLRRMKTYTASSGYVYQYYFVGQREAKFAGEAATEFIFDVTRDRHVTFAFSVFLMASAVAEWGAHHGRPPSDPERYAAAKMRLLRGFDELEATDLRQDSRQLTITAELLEELLVELGVG
jgi:hypothetical protein